MRVFRCQALCLIGSTLSDRGCLNHKSIHDGKVFGDLSYGSAGPKSVGSHFGGIEAHVTNLADQACRPTIHIILSHGFPHSLHAQLLFFRTHLDGGANGLGRLVDVVRVHLKRVAQFPCGAGKTTKNQHAAFVLPRRDEFFRHEIHSIMKRSHQAEISGPIVGLNLLVAMLTIQEYDRLPMVCAEAPVDAVYLGLHFCLQVVIALDVSATWSANLNKREHSLVARIFLEKPFDSQESLENSLGVVESVDADTHEGRFDAESFQ